MNEVINSGKVAIGLDEEISILFSIENTTDSDITDVILFAQKHQTWITDFPAGITVVPEGEFEDSEEFYEYYKHNSFIADQGMVVNATNADNFNQNIRFEQLRNDGKLLKKRFNMSKRRISAGDGSAYQKRIDIPAEKLVFAKYPVTKIYLDKVVANSTVEFEIPIANLWDNLPDMSETQNEIV